MRGIAAASLTVGAMVLVVGVAGGGRALADTPGVVAAPVQRFTIPPREARGARGMTIELASHDEVLAQWTDRTIHVLAGPKPGKTWPLGPSDRALLIATSDERNERTVRVLAVEEACDWHTPLGVFEDVVVNPGAGTFSFTRDIAELRGIPVRWESSATGVRVQRGAANGWYAAHVTAARVELSAILDRAAECTQASRHDGPHAVELATAIYVWSVASGANEKQARAYLSADLDAAPECTLALVNSPGWRADANVGALALGAAILEGRATLGASETSQCVSAPATVELRATRVSSPAPVAEAKPAVRTTALGDLPY